MIKTRMKLRMKRTPKTGEGGLVFGFGEGALWEGCRTVHEQRADAEREEGEQCDGVGGEAPVEGAWVVVGHAGGGEVISVLAISLENAGI